MQASDQAITYGRHIRALAILGIPIIVGQLGTIIQGLADTIMVASTGEAAMSSVSKMPRIWVTAWDTPSLNFWSASRWERLR